MIVVAWLKTFYENKKPLFLTGGVILLVLVVYVVSVFFRPSVPTTPPSGAPPTMTLEGSVWTGFGVPGSPVVARGDYAYAAPTEGDFQIFDIRDKQNPKIVGHVLVGFGNGVEVEGNYAYLKLLGSPPGGFVVVDISLIRRARSLSKAVGLMELIGIRRVTTNHIATGI